MKTDKSDIEAFEKEVEFLKSQIKRKDKMIDIAIEQTNRQRNSFLADIEKLKKQNELLLETVKFYAKSVNWSFSEEYSDLNEFARIDNDSSSTEKDTINLYGGKRARQCLTKIKEIEGNV